MKTRQQQTADQAEGRRAGKAIQEPAKTGSHEHPAHHFTEEAVTLRHRPVRLAARLLGLGRLSRFETRFEAGRLCVRLIPFRHASEGLWTATWPPRRGLQVARTYRRCCGASRLGWRLLTHCF